MTDTFACLLAPPTVHRLVSTPYTVVLMPPFCELLPGCRQLGGFPFHHLGMETRTTEQFCTSLYRDVATRHEAEFCNDAADVIMAERGILRSTPLRAERFCFRYGIPTGYACRLTVEDAREIGKREKENSAPLFIYFLTLFPSLRDHCTNMYR